MELDNRVENCLWHCHCNCECICADYTPILEEETMLDKQQRRFKTDFKRDYEEYIKEWSDDFGY